MGWNLTIKQMTTVWTVVRKIYTQINMETIHVNQMDTILIQSSQIFHLSITIEIQISWLRCHLWSWRRFTELLRFDEGKCPIDFLWRKTLIILHIFLHFIMPTTQAYCAATSHQAPPPRIWRGFIHKLTIRLNMKLHSLLTNSTQYWLNTIIRDRM